MDTANTCSSRMVQSDYKSVVQLPSYHQQEYKMEEPNSKTSEFYETQNIPDRFDNPCWFKGYEQKPCHPMFRTTNSGYGSRSPSVHTMPQMFRARSQKFTNDLGPKGMYRNRGLNTNVDQSPVPDHFKGHLYY